MKKLSLSVLFISLLISCNKPDEKITINELDSGTFNSNQQTWQIASNSNNIIDSIGLIHNLSLDYLYNNSNNNNFDSIYNNSNYYFLNNRSYSNVLNSINQNSIENIFINTLDEINTITSFSIVSDLTINSNSSIYYIQYMNDLFETLDLGMNIYDSITNNILYVQGSIIQNIKTLETDVINNLSISEDERLKILGTSSVMRYSLAYWTDVMTNPNNPHFNNYPSNNQPQAFGFWGRFWRGLGVVAGDAAGFAAGYGLGSALSGGVPAVGIAGGALIGGAMSKYVESLYDPK